MHPINYAASSVSSLKMSLTDLALAFSAGLQQSWGWRSGNRLLFLTHLSLPTVSDRQGADVNWLVLQALIKSTKSPFSFHFLLQGQPTYINGKCKKRRWAPKQLAVLGNAARLRAPAALRPLIACKPHQIVLVRGPQLKVLFTVRVILSISVVFNLFFSNPLHFLRFTTLRSPHALPWAAEAPLWC